MIFTIAIVRQLIYFSRQLYEIVHQSGSLLKQSPFSHIRPQLELIDELDEFLLEEYS